MLWEYASTFLILCHLFTRQPLTPFRGLTKHHSPTRALSNLPRTSWILCYLFSLPRKDFSSLTLVVVCYGCHPDRMDFVPHSIPNTQHSILLKVS